MTASRADFQEVTQKVKNEKKHSDKTRAKQGPHADTPEPNKITASTPFDFGGKNLTPYGGLFPVATMLEKLGFQKLVEEMLTVKRIPRVMTIYQFVLAMVLAIYVGLLPPQSHLRFVASDPHADRGAEGGQSARTEHVLAIPGVVASDRGAGNCCSCSGSCGNGCGPRRTCSCPPSP